MKRVASILRIRACRLRRQAAGRPRAAFTMIELLVVVAIIAILVGIVTSGVASARRQARVVQAESGVRELVDAWRAYWTVFGEWPGSLDGQSAAPATYGNLAPLLGDNPRNLVLLEADIEPGDPERDAFRDPWGSVYHMRFAREPVVDKQWVNVTVTFPNRDRYKQ